MKLPFAKKKQTQTINEFRNKQLFFGAKKPKHTTLPRNKNGLIKFGGKYRFVIIGLITIILTFLFLASFIASETFKIKRFEIIGNNRLSSNEIEVKIKEKIGENIFLTRTSAIEEDLLNSELFFEEVTVSKFFPDQLRIIVKEKLPNSTLISLNGIYLVDDEGTVVEIVKTQNVNFSSTDLDIIKGFGDPNSKIVRDRYYLNLESDPTLQAETSAESEDSEVDQYQLVPLNKKIATLEQIQAELQVAADDILQELNSDLSTTPYAGLPKVYAYSNDKYEVNDKIKLKQLEITTEVKSFFKINEGFIIERIVWESPYLISFNFTNGKKVYFGTGRDIKQQIEDFSLINERLKVNNEEYSQMDLSSSKVSVK